MLWKSYVCFSSPVICITSKWICTLQKENAEKELEFQKTRGLIMEKTKAEAKITFEQNEKQPLSRVWMILGKFVYPAIGLIWRGTSWKKFIDIYSNMLQEKTWLILWTMLWYGSQGLFSEQKLKRTSFWRRGMKFRISAHARNICILVLCIFVQSFIL